MDNRSNVSEQSKRRFDEMNEAKRSKEIDSDRESKYQGEYFRCSRAHKTISRDIELRVGPHAEAVRHLEPSHPRSGENRLFPAR